MNIQKFRDRLPILKLQILSEYMLAASMCLTASSLHAQTNAVYIYPEAGTENSSLMRVFEPSTWLKSSTLNGFGDISVGMSSKHVILILKEADVTESSSILGVERKIMQWRTSDFIYEVYFLFDNVVAKKMTTRK